MPSTTTRSTPPKALGATQITREKPRDLAQSKRIGDAAARHQVNVGYHLHTTASMTAWDDVIAQSPRNGLQPDIGHYVAGTGLSPVPLIEKHDRIFEAIGELARESVGFRGRSPPDETNATARPP